MLDIATKIILSFLLFTQIVSSQWDFAVTTKGKVRFYDKTWSEVKTAAHEFDDLSAIAFDEIHERIFFNDRRHDVGSIFFFQMGIGQKNPSKTDQLVARTQNERVEGITYDPVDQILFWTDSKNKIIYSLSVNNETQDSVPKELFKFTDGTRPDGIAVDICQRKLYWTNSNRTNPTIETSSLNGEDHKILFTTDLYRPHGIVVDQTSQRLFFVVDQEGMHFSVESANLNGTDRQILIKDIDSAPVSLTVTNDSIYWTDSLHQTVWRTTKNVDTADTQRTIVLRLDKEIPGIVSRQRILPILKANNQCQEALKKIEHNLFAYPNRTTIRTQSKNSLEVVCLNDGVYSDVSRTCVCEPGYSGSRCEIYDCHNYCAHGTCKIVAGFPKCYCQKGYTDKRCQTHKCTNFCMNGGQCEIRIDDPHCECQEDYFGSRCEVNTNETCLPFCNLWQESVEIEAPYFCHRVCKRLYPTDDNIKHLPVASEICRNAWNRSVVILTCGALTALVLIYLIIQAIRRVYKPARPRIKKTYVLQKKISQTPLTSRPVATQQCEITIENCCNMNICETPCFDPNLLKESVSKRTVADDKQMLIDNMEN